MVQKNPIVSISLVAVVAIAASKLDLFSPLSNGKIPAAKKQPHEHWSYIKKDLTHLYAVIRKVYQKLANQRQNIQAKRLRRY